jgi:hypothetical protein
MKNCKCWQQPDMAATLAGKKITNKTSTSLSQDFTVPRL